MDPFTQISQAIISALKANTRWAALIKPGDVIDMTANGFERFKTQLQPADVPEAVLLQGKFSLKPFGPCSTLAECMQEYQLIVTHESLRVTPVNLVKYQTLIALAKSGPTLGLNGLVRGWDIIQGLDDAFGPKQWQRGTICWVSAMTIRVEFYISRVVLIA